MKKALITGSSGTVGTRLSEILMNKGYDITGVDSKPNKWNEKVNKITLNLDLRDKKELLEKLPKDTDLIIHLAANARVYNLVIEPQLARDNFETTFNILEFARLNNIKKFIFASSKETYGNSEKTIYNESDLNIENCESPYTASKIAGEALVHSYQKCYDIDSIIFRFSNVYGMYDKSDRVIPLFIKLCKEERILNIFGKEKLLDFTYIDDCVNGIELGIKKFKEVKNNTYNLSSGEGTPIFKIAELIKNFTESKSEIVFKENRTGEVVKYIADNSKIKKKMNHYPETEITEGIEKTIEWYNDNL